MVRLIAVLFLAFPLMAQDAKSPEETLKVGASLPGSIRAYIVSDDRYPKGDPRNRPDKMHDLVTDNGLNPVIAVFSSSLPPEKLALVLHDFADEFKAYRVGAFMLVMDLDKEYPAEENKDLAADKKAKAVKDYSDALVAKLPAHKPFFASPLYLDRLSKEKPENPRLGVPVGLIEKKSAATDALGISNFNGLVVVLYDRMQVKKVKSFPGGKLEDKDYEELYKSAKEMLQPGK